MSDDPDIELPIRRTVADLQAYRSRAERFARRITINIAAVAVAFARFSGVLMPWISESRYLIAPVHLTTGYALSLSTAQLVGVLLIVLLTWTNTKGLKYGKRIQNVFTVAKVGSLLALVVVGLVAWTSHQSRKIDGLRSVSRAISWVLLLQLATGISTVLLNWPLTLAVLHNAGAAVLLVLLVMLNYLIVFSTKNADRSSSVNSIQA